MDLYDKIYSMMKNDIDGGCTSGANLLFLQNFMLIFVHGNQ